MTSSFQQMKEFCGAIKACQNDNNKQPKEPIHAIHSENDADLNTEVEGDLLEGEIKVVHQREEVKGQPNDSDSEDTIFYDAYDAMILDEIQKEYKRESVLSSHNEESEDQIRTTLPALKPEAKFSLLKILKDAVGKDLTKF